MVRPTALLLLLFGSAPATVAAYTAVLPQRASHFVGRDVRHDRPAAARGPRAALVMKGKAQSPQMRAQYKRAQDMNAYKKEMEANQKAGADGLPVFNLYVRTSMKNMWYPCGSFKGDDKSRALCQNYVDDGMLSGISKNQLDAGVGGSLFRDKARLEETIFRGYPQLRKEKGQLEYGYKLSYPGLSKEQEQVQVVEVKEQKGWLDGIKSAFGGGN